MITLQYLIDASQRSQSPGLGSSALYRTRSTRSDVVDVGVGDLISGNVPLGVTVFAGAAVGFFALAVLTESPSDRGW